MFFFRFTRHKRDEERKEKNIFHKYLLFLPRVNVQTLKILHIINSLSTGGAEKLIVDIIPLLNEEPHISADLALLNGKSLPFYEQLKTRNPKLNIFNLSRGSVYNPFLVFKIIPLLNQYDLIHVHLFPAQYWVVFAKILSLSKKKLIFTEHSTNNRRLNNPKYRFIDKFVYRFYHKIICISPEVEHELKQILQIIPEKLKVIRNGINVKEIENAKPEDRHVLGYDGKDIILIMIAGFRREKDHETLLKVMEKLPHKYKLLLVGDGERRPEIESLISLLKIENRVKLLGVRTDVYSLMKMSDIVILSSHWEGFGLAAAEAMAAKVPVIASNVPGLSQVVKGGGMLFEKGNVGDLENKIIQLSNDFELKKQYISFGKIKSNTYAIQEMIVQLCSVYKNIE